MSRLIAIAIIAVITAAAAYGLINGTIVEKEESHDTPGTASAVEGNTGQGGAGRGEGSLADLTVETEHLLKLEGKVVSEDLISSNYFRFASDGKTYDVNVGARWYWDYKGIKLSPGDSIVVTGFNVQGRGTPTLAASTVENKVTGKQVEVREKDGTPVWRDGSEDECQDSGIGGFSEQ